MRRHDDDSGVTSRQRLSHRTADRLASGRSVPEEPSLSAFVADLSGLVPETAPEPSYRLAVLLEQGPPVKANALVPQMGVQRRTHRLRRLSLAGVASLGLLLGAASVDTLPDPAQQVVSDVVGWVSPLELPTPHEDQPVPDRPRPTPAPGASQPPTGPTPAPEPSPGPVKVEPTPEPTEEPADEPTDEVTDEPIDEPTDEATEEPDEEPTDEPVDEPAADDEPPLGLGLPTHGPQA